MIITCITATSLFLISSVKFSLPLLLSLLLSLFCAKKGVMETIKKERKPGHGRRKIDIKKIQNKQSLQVTFTKRKGGLFKKASELSVLCGAQVALILFSPAGKPYTCGHPTPDHIIDRFLNNTDDLSKIHKGDELDECQRRFMEVEKDLEVEKKRGDMLQTMVNCNLGDNQFWWDAYIDGLSLGELKQMRSDMEQLQKIVAKRCDEVMVGNVDSSSWLMPADVNTVGADGAFDFGLDGQLSNPASSSNSSWMTADVKAVDAHDSSEDPLDYIDYSGLLDLC
ncbi:hypothetical protein MKW94_028523 [Papaver nudicaule]|uniref:MADS-box domain-containing protein n=1 Tax=Papaver nudicaule TaxID=74823 RepID=A0AA41VHP4_PAPNU|nr:hypothetical protein [Papaver nudicaule]